MGTGTLQTLTGQEWARALGDDVSPIEPDVSNINGQCNSAPRLPPTEGGAQMCSHFVVPCERSTNSWVHRCKDPVQLEGDFVGGDATDEVDKRRVATHPVGECADRVLVSGAEDEVAFPVARLAAISSASEPFGDRDHVWVVSRLSRPSRLRRGGRRRRRALALEGLVVDLDVCPLEARLPRWPFSPAR